MKGIKKRNLERDVARLLELLDLKDDFKEKLKAEIKREVFLEVMAALRVDEKLSERLNEIHEREGRKAYGVHD